MYAFGATASAEASTSGASVRDDAERSGKPITTLINYAHPVWLGILKQYPDAAKNLTHFLDGLQAELIRQGYAGKDINTIALAAITPIVNQLDASFPHAGLTQAVYNSILSTALPKAIWQAMPSLQAVQKTKPGTAPGVIFNITPTMVQSVAPQRKVVSEPVDVKYFKESGAPANSAWWPIYRIGSMDQPRVPSPEAPWYEQTKYQVAMAVGAVALLGGSYYYFKKH